MKIKTKLRLGFGFLFLVILFFGAISLFYLDKISGSAKVILKDNYESLNYTRQMNKVLDEGQLSFSAAASSAFGRYLKQEEANITEPGEKEAVAVLRDNYVLLTSSSEPSKLQQAMLNARLQLRKIEQMNMDAIVRKNDAAQQSVRKATIYLSFAACFSFLVLFSFIANFPGFVANPIRELSDGIREISRRNYKQRLQFKSNDEFSDLAVAFNEMASRLNEWENSNLAKLKSEKLRIEAIISQMQDAIIGINEKQEILFINTVAEQVLNLSGQENIGQNAAEVTKKNDLFRNILENHTTDKQLKIFADGKESYFQLDSREITVPVLDREEDIVAKSARSAGKVYILRNITRFKELDAAKTNFIATVSHELKTPIASIKMSLKLLSDDRVGLMNEEQKDLLQHISEDSNRLLKITSELLDLAKVEAGNLQLQFNAADPNEIANYAVDAVKFQAEQKTVKLEMVSRRVLPKVWADTEKTAWVLINFLSNALRYSPEKSRIVVMLIEKDGYIEFSVKDFGKGIDEQYQKRLFDRYFQVPTDGKNKSGSGLGLAISKDFIEAQKGKIWVESAIGEGSRFCFALPIVQGQEHSV